MSDPQLQQRIANALQAEGITADPKKMFGGVAFMVNDHMSAGITNKGDLMVRIDPARAEEMLQLPGAAPMSMGNKTMKGFIFVDPSAVETDQALKKWIKLSLDHILKLPPKVKKPSKSAVKKSPSAKK